jgi:hypothetical protein
VIEGAHAAAGRVPLAAQQSRLMQARPTTPDTVGNPAITVGPNGGGIIITANP